MLPAKNRRKQRDDERVDVKERERREERRVVAEELAERDHPRVGDLVRVRVRGELREPRRPAGMKVRGEIGRGGGRDAERIAPLRSREIGEVRDANAVERSERRARVRLHRGLQCEEGLYSGILRDVPRLFP